MHPFDSTAITNALKEKALELGFQQIGITDTDLSAYEKPFRDWLAQGFHGEMNYLKKNMNLRFQPDQIAPGTISIISARMDYYPPSKDAWQVLRNPEKAYVSRYALGRDYHRLMRKRLAKLGDFLKALVTPIGFRAFCDSAPVLEKAIAQKAGLGWIGKHTNLINKKAGSYFFLGELYTDAPLVKDISFTKMHCGSCHACLDICPTQAIIAPHQLDARRCISYLTIELKEAIPVELRSLIGNRIYGCDDCQLICPWNKFAKLTGEKDFYPRHLLDNSKLLHLFNWNEPTFLKNTEGSAIRRIGYECWQRNLAVALGNAPYHETIVAALKERWYSSSSMVQEHISWALQQLTRQVCK